MAPEMLQSLQLWGGPWQATDLEGERLGLAAPGRCRRGRASICTQPQVPAAPMPTHPVSEGLRGFVVPHLRTAQESLATLDVAGPREPTVGMRLPRHRDTALCPWPPLAVIER
jgi:hypothetical protein